MREEGLSLRDAVKRAAKELGLSPASQGLEVVVISDGELSLRSLGLCGKDQAWVRRRLQERGLGQEQVFLMTVRTDGKWRAKRLGGNSPQQKRLALSQPPPYSLGYTAPPGPGGCPGR